LNPLVLMMLMNNGLPIISSLFGKLFGGKEATPAATPAAGIDPNMMQMIMMMSLFSGGKEDNSMLPMILMMNMMGQGTATGPLQNMETMLKQIEEYKKTIDVLSKQIELMKGGK